MHLADTPPPIRHYLRVIRRQAWLIVLVPVLALGAAGYVLSRQDTVYRASMSIVLVESSPRLQTPFGNQPLTQTMRTLVKSDAVAREVARDLSRPISPSELLQRLHVEVLPDSSVLEVSYDSNDREEALHVLSEVARVFQALAKRRLGISTDLTDPGPLFIVTSVFDPPHLEPGRISPRPVPTLGFAGVLGLALGLILAFARESLDDRIRERGEMEELFGAPVIAALPRRFSNRPRIIGRIQPRRDAEESLQLLRTNLQLSRPRLGSTVLVTSAADRERPAAIVANLGVALARAGSDVLCVEADVRQPALAQLLGISERRPGLASILSEGEPQLDSALHEIELRGAGDGDHRGNQESSNGRGDDVAAGRLLVLPAGESSSETVIPSGEQLASLVRLLASRADYVLIDAPGLLRLSAAIAFVPAVDSVLLVAPQGRTSRSRAGRAREMLELLGARNVALVLTGVRKPLAAMELD